MCCVSLLTLCFFFKLQVWQGEQSFRNTKSNPTVGAREATVRRGAGEITGRVRCKERKARPYERKNCAIIMKTRRIEPVRVIGCDQEPRGTCLRTGNIIGTVDSIMRGALVRQVSPAEGPAESAVRKAPMCKEPPAVQAQELRDQSKSRRRS